MKKIFLILLIIGFTLSLKKLNNNWEVEFNKGAPIKLRPGVYTKVPIQLTNTKILDLLQNDQIIYILELIQANQYIVTEKEMILNPNEKLSYLTYIGLKCTEINPKPEDNKIKYKIYYNNKNMANFLGEIELILELQLKKDQLTEINLEVVIKDMPGKSLNYFRLEEEIYNIDEIEIVPKNDKLKSEGFVFNEIVIKPYFEREELY